MNWKSMMHASYNQIFRKEKVAKIAVIPLVVLSIIVSAVFPTMAVETQTQDGGSLNKTLYKQFSAEDIASWDGTEGMVTVKLEGGNAKITENLDDGTWGVAISESFSLDFDKNPTLTLDIKNVSAQWYMMIKVLDTQKQFYNLISDSNATGKQQIKINDQIKLLYNGEVLSGEHPVQLEIGPTKAEGGFIVLNSVKVFYNTSTDLTIQKINPAFCDPSGSERNKYKDIKDISLEKKVNTLESLGIMVRSEDALFKPDDTITRAQLAEILSKLAGGNLQSTQVTMFQDVPNTHPNVTAITNMAQQGIMSGVSKENFSPDTEITIPQTVKAILTLLGYKYYANSFGEYPNGFMAVAGQKGLLNGIAMDNFEAVTRQTFVQMLYKAIDIDIIEQVSFGADNIYQATKKQTILSEVHSIYKSKGQVKSNGFSSIRDEAFVNKDEVMIEDTTYKVGDSSASLYLGCSVDFYYKKDKASGDSTIVYITPNEEVLTIQANDITSVSIDGRKLDYKKDGIEKTVSLNADVDVIFNGKAMFAYTPKDLKPEVGQISLLDDQSGYSIAVVTAYDTYILDSVNTLDKIVYSKYNMPKLTIDQDDNKDGIKIRRNGQSVTINDLKVRDVLSVAASKDGMLKDIAVSRSKVAGQMQELLNNTDECTATILGVKYKVVGNYKELIKIKDDGDFNIDAFGNIAGVNNALTGNDLGYLIDKGIEGGLGGDLKLKLITEQGVVKMFKVAKRILVNDVPKNSDQSANDAIVAKQLIRYSLNDALEVYKLYTAKDAGQMGFDENSFSLDYTSASSTFSSGRFDAIYTIPTQIKVFLVPKDNDETKYKVTSAASLIDDRNYTDVSIYDSSKFKIAGAVVVNAEDANTGIGIWSKPAVVDKLTRVIDENGSIVYKIAFWRNGKRTETTFENTVDVKNVDTTNIWGYSNVEADQLICGDIIQLDMDADGLMNRFKVLSRISGPLSYDLFESGTKAAPDLRSIGGAVSQSGDGYFTVKLQQGEDNLKIGTSEVYVYNTASSKLYKSDSAKVQIGLKNVKVVTNRFEARIILIVD